MSTPVVLITGGLSGIGPAAAIAFAKKGAKVVVAGRRDDAGKTLVDELRCFGSEAEFINADVRKEMTSARWSTRPSHGLAVSMSRSTTPRPKARAAR
jgi:NAD(P)-dependent dehydrogenase (short-subunit alcohol dehydrogenase family)